MLRFFCGGCGTKYKINPDFLGRRLKCRHCHSVLSLPATLSNNDVLPPEPDSPKLKTCILTACTCGRRYHIASTLTGRRALCPSCGRRFVITPLTEQPQTKTETLHSVEEPVSFRDIWYPGSVIDGEYRVERLLGRGGMGEVWKVWHLGWDVPLAVKVMLTERDMDEEVRHQMEERFIREALTWVGLGSHPHVVAAYTVRRVAEVPCIFVEYVGGGDLSGWLREGRLQDTESALKVAIQIADGMAYAHHYAIIHRDLKPKNVLMTEDGDAKISDFGLVKRWGMEEAKSGTALKLREEMSDLELPEGVFRTLTRGAMGTPQYMAPEQWEAAHIVGPEADIYSYGVML